MDSANASSSGPAEAAPAVAGLSERDGQILAFERHWWKYAGAKEQAKEQKEKRKLRREAAPGEEAAS